MTGDVKNFKSEYEEKGFWLSNNIMWTAENAYQTIQQILYNSIFRGPPRARASIAPHLTEMW